MKNKFFKLTGLFMLLSIILTSCATAPKGAMVKIGKKYITEEDVNKEFDRVISSYSDEQKKMYDETTDKGKEAINSLKQNILDMFSNNEVIKQKLSNIKASYEKDNKSEEEISKVTVTEKEVNDGLDKIKNEFANKFNEELEKAKLTEEELKNRIEEQLYSTKFQVWFSENYSPTDEEIMDKYKSSPYYGPQINASHILVNTEEEAKNVKNRLNSGEKFEDLAKELSIDPSAKENLGSLGSFTKGVMVQEFYDAASKLKVGEISDPVKSQFGFHIIKLNEIVNDYENFDENNKESIKQKIKQSILSDTFKKEFANIQKEVGYLPIKNFK